MFSRASGVLGNNEGHAMRVMSVVYKARVHMGYAQRHCIQESRLRSVVQRWSFTEERDVLLLPRLYDSDARA